MHYLTFLLKKRRTILTIHDFVLLEQLSGCRRWIIWLLWYFLPAKKSAKIVVISNSTKRQLLAHIRYPEEDVHVIYNSVSSEFTPSVKQFNAESPRILQIGTKPNKNLSRVAEAISNTEATLVIIGPLTRSQHEMLKMLQVRYENHIGISRDELVNQYRLCDLLVFASTYEGFGLPIVEANAVGRPVVTSDWWSMPEVAADAACLVDPSDVKSIRNGIERVIGDADYREKLIQLGFENAKRFAASSIAELYAQLYRQVANDETRLKRPARK
ncbi:glycosyltransferase family 4 protein [Mesorhizobium sp. M1163]